MCGHACSSSLAELSQFPVKEDQELLPVREVRYIVTQAPDLIQCIL